ncbi:MAG TPA: hypothetical protein VK176_09540 [Phycisphaerales bacterium]|nr:hypothetical protein [Phycisphaerales bacterium]
MDTPRKSWIARHPYLTGSGIIIALILCLLVSQVILAVTAKPGVGGLFAVQIQGISENAQKDLAEPDLWKSAVEVAERIRVAERAAWDGVGIPSPNGGLAERPADWPENLAWPPESAAVGTDQTHTRVEEFYRSFLSSLRDGGVLKELHGLTELRRAVRPIPPTRAIEIMLPELGAFRNISRLNHARMMFAVQDGDLDEFASAFEDSLAVARIAGLQPILISHLVGVAITAHVHQDLQYLIADGALDVATLGRIEAAMERQDRMLSMEQVLDAERFMQLDTVEWTHSQSGRPILQEIMQLSSSAGGGMQGSNFGGVMNVVGLGMPSKSQVVEVIDHLHDLIVQDARKPAHLRPAVLAADVYLGSLSPRHVLVKLLWPAMSKALMVESRIANDKAATRVMIALERFRRARGVYPAALAELVPEFLAELPRDEFDPGGFRYVLKKAEASAAADGYVLYSIGDDRVDNGGTNTKPELRKVGGPDNDLIYSMRRHFKPRDPAEK